MSGPERVGVGGLGVMTMQPGNVTSAARTIRTVQGLIADMIGFAGGDVKSAGMDGCRLTAYGLQHAVHLSEPRDLVPDVGERIGEAERVGMKSWPEAVGRRLAGGGGAAGD